MCTDLHPDLGVACGEYHASWRGRTHWKGIDFQDAEYTQELQLDRTQYIKVLCVVITYTISNIMNIILILQ